MTTLRCTRYPQMQIVTPHGRVRFVDGVAEVTEEQAGSVLGLSVEQYGITADADADAGAVPAETDGGQVPPPPPDPQNPAAPVVERPPQGAPKADWVAYADTVDPGDHSQMTKEQLIKQYGG